MTKISEPITLEEWLPLIQELSQNEREQLREFLETDSATMEGKNGKISVRALPGCLCQYAGRRSDTRF